MKKNPLSSNTPDEMSTRPNNLSFPFEKFDTKLIAKDKLGISVDILQKHLINVFEFSTNENKNRVFLNILEMYKADLNFTTQFLTIYDSINILYANILQHVFQIDSTLKKQLEITEKEIKKVDFSSLQEQINDYEEDISNTKNLMNLDLQCCTREDLALTYQDLLKSKDAFEILIMKNIVILLSSNYNASPENVRKKVHHYTLLTKEMKLFDNSSLSLFQLSNILIGALQVLDQIDPTKVNPNSSNYGYVEKYRHLVSYALWLAKACELLIKKIKKEDLEKKLAKIMTEKSNKVDIMNYFKKFKELNSIIIKSNEEQNTFINVEMKECSKKVELEIQKITTKIEPKFFPEASLLNSLLNEEEEKIMELYYNNSNYVYQMEDNICEMDKKSIILENKMKKSFLCGFCGVAKNK